MNDLRLPISSTRATARKETGPRALLVLLAQALVVASFVASISPGVALAASPDEHTPIDLALYARLLEEHTKPVSEVVGTRVDYRSLAKSGDWKRLVGQVRAARPSKLDRNEQLAFWLNTYNVLTIELVTDHYPIDSIRDIGSFFSPVWDKTVATIEGQKLSLGFIEHEILRKMGEPRIHAAIVCASTSCPALARTPFRADSIDADLDAAVRVWLENPEKGVALDRSTGRVRLSKIFDWFAEDFEARGGILAFVADYVAEEDARWLRAEGKNARIEYMDYDWSLNDLR